MKFFQLKRSNRDNSPTSREGEAERLASTPSRKRLLIISIFYAPDLIGVSKYTGEMAAWIAENDFEVKVITGYPFYPEWKLRSGYPTWRYSEETLDGVKIIRCPLWVPKQVNGISRMLHLLSFGITSGIATLTQLFFAPTAVLLVLPTVFNLPFTLLFSKLSGCRAWLHVQDFEIDLAENLNIVNGGEKLFHYFKKIESWFFQQFHTVSTISFSMYQRLIDEKNVEPQRALLLPNWVDVESIYPLERPSDYRRTLNIPNDKVVVLYSGNMGKKYGLDILAETARYLETDDQIFFVFCGDGAGKADLQTLCSGLSNVKFLPLQPLEQLNELLNLADIHLLPQKPDAATSVMPSKLLGMMASGRPTVATVEKYSEIAGVLKNGGLVVPPGNPFALADAVTSLSNDQANRLLLGGNSRITAVNNFGQDATLCRLLDELNVSMAPKGLAENVIPEAEKQDVTVISHTL